MAMKEADPDPDPDPDRVQRWSTEVEYRGERGGPEKYSTSTGYIRRVGYLTLSLGWARLASALSLPSFYLSGQT